MGTRGAYGFRIGGQDKLTYNHFDSYPDGLGEVIVQFCNTLNEEMLKTLKKKAKALKLVSEDKKPTKAQVEKYKKFANTGVSTGDPQEWYVLMRNLQFGEILPVILSGDVTHMIDGNEFILDSLFCEFAYILDLDNDVLEMYQGCQKTPDPNNRYGQKGRSSCSGTVYYPCKKICEFPILKIPPDWEDIFENDGEDDEPFKGDLNMSGNCPKCGSNDVDYGSRDNGVCGEQMNYPMTCNVCGFKGKEYYSIEFSHYTDEEDEEISNY